MEHIFKNFHINPEDNDAVIVKLVEIAISNRERQTKKGGYALFYIFTIYGPYHQT